MRKSIDRLKERGRRLGFCLFVVGGLLAGASADAFAQRCGAATEPDLDVDFPPSGGPAAEGEPLFEGLEEQFKQRYLRLSTLLQIRAEAGRDPLGPDSTDGFRVANARLELSGILDEGFAYELEGDLAGGVELKDARISYCLGPNLTLDAGQFKPPISREALTSTSETPFVGRARVVDALVPGRQVGVEADLRFAGGHAVLRGGFYNGSGPLARNDDRRFLYAARLGVKPPGLGGALVAGGNVAYDDSGGTLLVGADIKGAPGRLLLSAEALVAWQDAPGPAPFGCHLTAGYSVATGHQVLARLDRFEGRRSRVSSGGASDTEPPDYDLVAGYVFIPTRPTRIEVNLRLPARPATLGAAQVLVNLQLGF